MNLEKISTHASCFFSNVVIFWKVGIITYLLLRWYILKCSLMVYLLSIHFWLMLEYTRDMFLLWNFLSNSVNTEGAILKKVFCGSICRVMISLKVMLWWCPYPCTLIDVAVKWNPVLPKSVPKGCPIRIVSQTKRQLDISKSYRKNSAADNSSVISLSFRDIRKILCCFSARLPKILRSGLTWGREERGP